MEKHLSFDLVGIPLLNLRRETLREPTVHCEASMRKKIF